MGIMGICLCRTSRLYDDFMCLGYWEGLGVQLILLMCICGLIERRSSGPVCYT